MEAADLKQLKRRTLHQLPHQVFHASIVCTAARVRTTRGR